MAPSHTIQRHGRARWTLMTAIHDALRRDLDQLLHTTASRTAARARWIVFRGQLHYHLAAEQTAMWRPARAKLTGDPHGQALLDAMEDEHQLIGPLQAVTNDAFTMDADPRRLRQLLTRLRARLTSHLAHEEADALPLIGQIMSPSELGGAPGDLVSQNSYRDTAPPPGTSVMQKASAAAGARGMRGMSPAPASMTSEVNSPTQAARSAPPPPRGHALHVRFAVPLPG
jgi:hypothetical protein